MTNRLTGTDTTSARKSLISDHSSFAGGINPKGTSGRSLSPTSFIFTNLLGVENMLSRNQLRVALGFRAKLVGCRISSGLRSYEVLHEYLNRK